MKKPAYLLDAVRREIVLGSIAEVCRYRGWVLLAVHVRETHVHVVVDGKCPPEVMLDNFKQYASRALNSAELDGLRRKRWTRHGSTKILHARAACNRAVGYILEKQGAPMAVYAKAGQRAP